MPTIRYISPKGTRQEEIDLVSARTLIEARATCWAAVSIREIYDLVLDNLEEIEVELLRITQRAIYRPSPQHSTTSDIVTLNRRLLNFLSSTRQYFDHSIHLLSSHARLSQTEIAVIEGVRNKLYDEHFEYRLMESLRNHIQHSGHAIWGLLYSSKTENSAGNTEQFISHTVQPILDKDDLIANRDIKAALRAELKSIRQDIDIRKLIRVYFDCITKVQNCSTRLIEPSYLKARQTIDGFWSSIVDQNSGGLIIELYCPEVTKSSQPAVIWDEHFALFDRTLSVRTPRDNLARCFASNSL